MTQKKTYRIAQINRLLREEIAAILLTELQDDLMRAITVTEVRASRDLHTAIVFITAHKSEGAASVLEAANRNAGLIRKILYPRLRLRSVPILEFRYDESLDTAERIYRALEQIRENEPENQDEESNAPDTQDTEE